MYVCIQLYIYIYIYIYTHTHTHININITKASWNRLGAAPSAPFSLGFRAPPRYITIITIHYNSISHYMHVCINGTYINEHYII